MTSDPARTSDLPLTIKPVPVGLSRLTSVVKDDIASGSRYSNDLLFGIAREYGSRGYLAVPAAIPADAENYNFFCPIEYRDDAELYANRRVDVVADLPPVSAVLLWSSRCFSYDGVRTGGDVRMALSIHRGVNDVSLMKNYGSPSASVPWSFITLAATPVANFPSNPDGTHAFSIELTWAHSIPTVTVKNACDTSILSANLFARDVPLSGSIGGILYRTDAVRLPGIRLMSWGPM